MSKNIIANTYDPLHPHHFASHHHLHHKIQAHRRCRLLRHYQATRNLLSVQLYLPIRFLLFQHPLEERTEEVNVSVYVLKSTYSKIGHANVPFRAETASILDSASIEAFSFATSLADALLDSIGKRVRSFLHKLTISCCPVKKTRIPSDDGQQLSSPSKLCKCFLLTSWW